MTDADALATSVTITIKQHAVQGKGSTASNQPKPVKNRFFGIKQAHSPGIPDTCSYQLNSVCLPVRQANVPMVVYARTLSASQRCDSSLACCSG